MTFEDVNLLVENYKSFGEEASGFEQFLQTNVIIGRNNSGKSALLDLVEWACAPSEFPRQLWHAGKPPKVTFRTTLSTSVVKSVFQENVSHGDINGNHWAAGRHLVGKRIDVYLKAGASTLLKLDEPMPFVRQSAVRQYAQALASRVQSPFKGKLFRRLTAERDVVPEQATSNLSISKSGVGFTNVVAQVITKFDHPTSLVTDAALEALNEIFAPDAFFESIDVQQYGDGNWEIFLKEKGKGAIALSHSGSGLKTILLVIGYFVFLPYVEKKDLSEFIFAFEELENNLHPALQRRLARYVTDQAAQHRTPLLLTTHSNVLIDIFSHNQEAQIIHVTQAGNISQARRVQTYVENQGILDDLDVRASDLLQSNVVIWLEGPSDRLYFNRWVELVTDGRIKEGSHYQCIFYGGRLLAHLSANDPTIDADKAVKILRVNRNAILLIDSDKSDDDEEINSTKKRIVYETEAFGGIAWVTQGREVENYLPHEALSPKLKKPPGQFEDISTYFEKAEKGAGKRFERNKVMYAETVLPQISRETLKKCLDLEERLAQAVSAIRKWNGLE